MFIYNWVFFFFLDIFVEFFLFFVCVKFVEYVMFRKLLLLFLIFSCEGENEVEYGDLIRCGEFFVVLDNW